MQTGPSLESQLQNGRAALQRRHHWVAVPAFKAVVEADPDNVDAYGLSGIAQSLANNPTAARAAFLRATRLEPGRVSAHFNFALLLYTNNDLDEAAEELQTTLFLDPDHARAVELQKQLNERLKFRDVTHEEGFAVVGARGLNLE